MAYSIEIIDALNLLNNLTRQSNAHKGQNGSIACLGGSSGMAGAILSQAQLFQYLFNYYVFTQSKQKIINSY